MSLFLNLFIISQFFLAGLLVLRNIFLIFHQCNSNIFFFIRKQNMIAVNYFCNIIICFCLLYSIIWQNTDRKTSLNGHGSLPSSVMELPWKCPGPGCSKLTTSLVNDSLKFQTLISQICQYFLLKKCEKLLHCKSFSHFFNKKYQCILLSNHTTLNKLTF